MKYKSITALFIALAAISCSTATVDPTDWPEIRTENRPGLRWWWLGSAVDSAGLDYNLSQFASKGFGTVEITPLYGVIGNEANDIRYLSPEWMDALGFCIRKGHSLGMEVDMSGGTGWPFGGPWIGPENAAKTFEFNADTSAFVMVGTGQMVKRAAPGGEGYVMDHMSKTALDVYLAPFDSVFAASGCPWPDMFFNDSYEVYGSGWTDGLPDAFYADHGYRIEDHVKEFALNGATPESERVVADYRETISNLYMHEFVRPWGEWCRSHGVPVRHQAHGAPANLLDVYAAADIPEIEAFGQTPFEIQGLHRSGYTRLNDADEAMFKFASSAAHVTGKPLVSCETLTWLTEHFHTSLALCKPEIDLALVSGVNHVMLHGAPYSPEGAQFPGWKFYASINMSPANPSIWEVSSTLADYISRCQAFLSQGSPDADFLMYFPIYDIWHGDFKTQFMMLSIHDAEKIMKQFKNDVHNILSMGYDVDYVSDSMLQELSVMRDGRIRTSGGTCYKGLVLPTQTAHMPQSTRRCIENLRSAGVRVLALDQLGDCPLPRESARNIPGIHMIRRKMDDMSSLYFIANLGPDEVSEVTVSCRAEAVEAFDPMTGERGFAQSRIEDGKTRVRIDLGSGASIILRAFPKMPGKVSCGSWKYLGEPVASIALNRNPWALDFLRSAPAMPSGHYDLDSLTLWNGFEGGDVTEAVGCYSTSFSIPDQDSTASGEWMLDLGEVYESAVVRINGTEAGTLIAAPFKLRVGKYLHSGENTLEIEVRNLPANRISQMDRDGVVWRIFKDCNIACVKPTREVPPEKLGTYAWWPAVPSGLAGPVTLTLYVND